MSWSAFYTRQDDLFACITCAKVSTDTGYITKVTVDVSQLNSSGLRKCERNALPPKDITALHVHVQPCCDSEARGGDREDSADLQEGLQAPLQKGRYGKIAISNQIF